MHSKKESLLKRLHSLTIAPKRCESKWAGQYWQEAGADRVVSCGSCRSFQPATGRCGIGFGTPLRKCVVSSIEAHFHSCAGEEALEIGYGRFKLARNLIVRSGGRWTGVDPRHSPGRPARLGKGGHGHASHLPFPDGAFDRVFGVQSIEHWGQRAAGVREPSSYEACFAEIWRVLKPNGRIYFDAPVHFHGNEMFIMGDLDRVLGLLPEGLWSAVTLERWREDYAPLERYAPSENEFKDWPVELVSYPENAIAQARADGVVWMLVITATKRCSETGREGRP